MLVDHYITSQKRARQKGQGSITSDVSSEFEDVSRDLLRDIQAEDRQIDHIGQSLRQIWTLRKRVWEKDDDDDDDDDEDARVKLFSNRDDLLEVRTERRMEKYKYGRWRGWSTGNSVGLGCGSNPEKIFQRSRRPLRMIRWWKPYGRFPKKGSIFGSGFGSGTPRALMSSSVTSGKSGRFSNISFSLPKRGRERASIDPAALSPKSRMLYR